MKRYTRVPLEVTAYKYEVGKGMEDGFRLFSEVITTAGLSTEHLVKITRPDGTIVCPYVENHRGLIFIAEGDYIICEGENEKHVCGEDSFADRFQPIDD